MPPEEIAPEILSKILLIQNMLPTLPDADSMLGFTSRGLEDMPGVKGVRYALADGPPKPTREDSEVWPFPVLLGKSTFATIYCAINDPEAFSPYEAYVHNLCFMIAARLEENRQREAAAEYGEQLEREVRQRTRELELAREEAERERARAERYLDAAETFVVELDARGLIERINHRGAELFGCSPEEIEGQDWFVLATTEEERPKRLEQYRAWLEGRLPLLSHEDVLVRTASGELRFIHWHNILRFNSSGAAEGILSSGVDVTERKRAEEEKEVLLKEVYHRTKNNMHVISSLLALQSAASSSEDVKLSLLDAQNRIMAMALVHNMLYSSEELAHLDLHKYLRELGVNLLSGYSANAARIQFSVTGAEILVSLETAISCGIVLNEIMTNSAKHAFSPTTEEPEISIELHRDEEAIEIRYRDNGTGLPDGLDIAETGTLGMQIVQNIAVEQLQGSLSVGGNGGFEATIRFPDDLDSE